MGLNEFPPQPREGLMTKRPPCAPWPAASLNQGIWHLPKLFGFEELRGWERRGFRRRWSRRSGKMTEEKKKTSARENTLRRNKREFRKF